MSTKLQTLKRCFLLLAAGTLLMSPAAADADADRQRDGMRSEVWLAFTRWQSLGDLQPVVGGSFKSVGYGLGGAVHWPWKAVRGGDFLVGFEGAVSATDSDIPVIFDELLARNLYLAVSLKWQVGHARRLSLDTGFAYHLLDIAQLETDYNPAGEFESWEKDTFGPFVGMTWDFDTGEDRDSSGMTLGLRAHFLELGTVRDEDILVSAVLGGNAGKIDGPLLMLHLGYRWW